MAYSVLTRLGKYAMELKAAGTAPKDFSGPTEFRTHRPPAAGRRRARRLSGRRLPGAGRGRSASRLGRRHLDRRHQFRPHRRQSAGAARRAPARILGERDPLAARPLGMPTLSSLEIKNDMVRTDGQPGARPGRPVVRRAGLLQAAHPAADLVSRRQPRARSASTTSRRSRATLERLVDFDRINAGEMRFSVGAIRCAPAISSISTAPRTGSAPEHVMASGSLPPGFPGDRDRRRALLGWRHRLQHAAAMGAQTATAAATRSPSRSTCGAPAASCRAT